jgi:putative tryptophan/tyrosine transport system substrate-binding protein
MKRRQFITLVGGAAAAWPLAARAQQASRVRAGFVDFAGENDPNALDRARVFKQGLERLGWAPMIDYYWSVFNVERAQRAARDVLKLTPDVIVCAGTPATKALKQATSTVPIVFAIVTEPVAQGIVESLAHPCGNLTGFPSAATIMPLSGLPPSIAMSCSTSLTSCTGATTACTANLDVAVSID